MSILKSKDQASFEAAKASVISDPVVIRRVEIMCELFDLAYEMKSLELQRRNPDATDDWIRSETLRLIEAGTK